MADICRKWNLKYKALNLILIMADICRKFEIPSIILRNLLKKPSKQEIVLYYTICMRDKMVISPLYCHIAENLKN